MQTHTKTNRNQRIRTGTDSDRLQFSIDISQDLGKHPTYEDQKHTETHSQTSHTKKNTTSRSPQPHGNSLNRILYIPFSIFEYSSNIFISSSSNYKWVVTSDMCLNSNRHIIPTLVFVDTLNSIPSGLLFQSRS